MPRAFGWTRTRNLRVRTAAPFPTRPRRRSSSGNRTLPSGLEDPSPSHRPSHRAPCGNRTRDPRFAGACLAAWLPVQSWTRSSIVWSRHSGSNRAFSLTMRACRAADTVTAIVERTGIEPAAAALQVQLAPLEHASPEASAVPTRIELAYRGRQPRILTRGFRNRARVCEGNRTLSARVTDSRATTTPRTP